MATREETASSNSTIWLASLLSWVLIEVMLLVVPGPRQVLHGAKALHWHPQNGLVTESTLFEGAKGQAELVVGIQYDYGGAPHRCERRLADTAEHLRHQSEVFLRPGQTVKCRVNPANPAEAMLDSEYVMFEFFLVAAIAMTALCLLIPAVWVLWRRQSEQAGWAKAGSIAARVGTALACIFVLVFCGIATGRGFVGAARMLGTLGWTRASATIEKSSVLKERHGQTETWDYRVELSYRYQYGGASYSGTNWSPFGEKDRSGADMRKALEKLHSGDVIPCFVNPRNANEAFLERCATSYLGLPALVFLLAFAAWVLWTTVAPQKLEEDDALELETIELDEEGQGAAALAAGLPLHLQYELTRKQRLVPHMRLWTPLWLIIAAIFAVSPYAISRQWWYIAVPVVLAWYWRGFFIGLADVLLHRERSMDVLIEEQGLGVSMQGKRRWLRYGGVLSFRKLTKDLWTLSHGSGVVVGIPAALLSKRQLAFLKLMALTRPEEGAGDDEPDESETEAE